MKTEKELRKHLDLLYKNQAYIEKNIPSGMCHWRINKGKIELLQWVLDEE